MSILELTEEEQAIFVWRTKKLIKELQTYQGIGTSVLTLVIPAKENLSKMSQKLVDEYGTATNIKRRVNRQSVEDAIVSAQQKIKQYKCTPPNGLIIFSGNVICGDGRERRICIAHEPFKPILGSVYHCGSVFITDMLAKLLNTSKVYGFVIIDGHGALFGQLENESRIVIKEISVDLPKKHGRGGQSSVRFARIRLEKRHHYIKKVAETMNMIYITGNSVNVLGMILAGSADFKNELKELDCLDKRIREKIIAVLDISYGSETGFIQAIELSKDYISEIQFIKEKKILEKLLRSLALDSQNIILGLEEIHDKLEMGTIAKIIIWDEFPFRRRLTQTSPETDPKQIFVPEATDMSDDVIEDECFLEWISNHYKDYGIELDIVSDKTEEGSQFCYGLGGIGAYLRYKISTN